MRRAIDLQGHRGARGLFPENTLSGFAGALAIGVTTLELDVTLTADGIVVVSHDPRLNPDHTRTGDGAWLRQPGASIGSRMPHSSLIRCQMMGRASQDLPMCSGSTLLLASISN
jgi:glycerophosphoryl diester phosphodiesterase